MNVASVMSQKLIDTIGPGFVSRESGNLDPPCSSDGVVGLPNRESSFAAASALVHSFRAKRCTERKIARHLNRKTEQLVIRPLSQSPG